MISPMDLRSAEHGSHGLHSHNFRLTKMSRFHIFTEELKEGTVRENANEMEMRITGDTMGARKQHKTKEDVDTWFSS